MIKSVQEEDIRILVSRHVTGDLAKIVASSLSLSEEIVTTIIAKSEGMFIIAKIIDSIPDLLTTADIRTALKLLPTGLRDTYLMIMGRIWSQKPRIVELAKKALLWMYFSQRQLTVLELQHAVSFRRGATTISEETLVAENAILSCCRGLIVFVVNKRTATPWGQDWHESYDCQFSHFTAKEFLDTCWKDYFPEGDKHIAQTCLEYLTITVSSVPAALTERIIHSTSPDDDAEWKQYRTHRFALCRYATTYWGAHVKAINEDIDLDAGADFFKHSISPYTAGKDSSIIPPTTNRSTALMPPSHHWFLYSARFGIMKSFQRRRIDLLSSIQNAQEASFNYDDIRDDQGRTALHFAAWYGHLEVVDFLLNHLNADPNQLAMLGQSSLAYAAMAGTTFGVDIVRLLLDNGAIVDQAAIANDAPIFCALLTPDEPSPDVIRLLLQHEVDIYRAVRDGRTALSLGLKSEFPEIRQLLEEYARTHPPTPRTYNQCFPEDYFTSMDWESCYASCAESSESTQLPRATSSETTEGKLLLIGDESASVTVDTPLQPIEQDNFETGTSASTSAMHFPATLELPEPMPIATLERGHAKAKAGFRRFLKDVKHSFQKKG